MPTNNCGYIFQYVFALGVLIFSAMTYAEPSRILCWIVDSTAKYAVVPDDDQTRWPQLFSEISNHQNRFIFPLMDLDDSAVVNSNMIRHQFLPPLRLQSARYDADLILIVQASFNGLRWLINWQLADAKTQGQILIKGHVEGSQHDITLNISAAISDYEKNNMLILTENDTVAPPLGILLSSEMPNQAPVQEKIPLY